MSLKVFDLDASLTIYFRSSKDLKALGPLQTLSATPGNQSDFSPNNESGNVAATTMFTPYANSFASRLYGTPRLSRTVTADEAWMSPYHGRKLRPYIRRDWESRPGRAKLL